MYNAHPHISTQEVSISAKNGDERITLRNERWAVTRANRRHRPYNTAALLRSLSLWWMTMARRQIHDTDVRQKGGLMLVCN